MRKTLRRGSVLLVSLLCALAVPAASAEQQEGTGQIYLPEPPGPYRTGTTLVHLTDHGRADELAPVPQPRELMAQLWYPAVPSPRYPRAAYALPLEAEQMQRARPELPHGAFRGAVTNSLLDAPAIGRDHPVVLFSPGLCSARTDTTASSERLASLGFVVVALASTHEAAGVEFPGGRLVTTADPRYCEARRPGPGSEAVLARLQGVRVADVRFVLDELTRLRDGVDPDTDGKPVPHGLPGALDLHRIGIFGHSLGGSTAAQALADDPRLSAGVNLDGLVLGPVRRTGLAKPFLVLGSDYHNMPEDPAHPLWAPDPSWADFLPALTGWHHWLRYRGAGHYRFMDYGGSTGRWGLDETLRVRNPLVWEQVFGDIDGKDPRHSQQIVLRYTTAFFRKFLENRPEPILDHPSARYPEIEFRQTCRADGWDPACPLAP